MVRYARNQRSGVCRLFWRQRSRSCRRYFGGLEAVSFGFTIHSLSLRSLNFLALHITISRIHKLSKYLLIALFSSQHSIRERVFRSSRLYSHVPQEIKDKIFSYTFAGDFEDGEASAQLYRRSRLR